MNQIHKLQATDLGLAKELFRFFQTDDQVEQPTEASDMYLTNLLKRQDFHVLAATGNDQLLGGLTAYELPKYKSEVIEIFLYELGVKPEFRQKGIGKKLALELIALCKNRGIMQLFVMTTRYNIAALELFKDLGGQPDMDSIKFSFKL